MPEISRRELLRRASLTAGTLIAPLLGCGQSQPSIGPKSTASSAPKTRQTAAREIDCDVLVVGGSLGGVAAALRAAAMGARVRLVEESGWIGGQLTYQGVCTPDDNLWVLYSGSTAAYQALLRSIRKEYQTRHRLSPRVTEDGFFNPGDCWVSQISFEPRVAHQVMRDMLGRFPNLTIHDHTRITGAKVRKDAILYLEAVGPKGERLRFRAAYYLDATDVGDLLPLVGAEWVIGAESKAQTGEPDAPDRPHPEWVQPFTFPFALERCPAGENHTIIPPPDYAALKQAQRYGLQDGTIYGMFRRHGLWRYRRIIAAENFLDRAYPYDVSIINTRSNDYSGAPYPTHSPAADAETLARGRRAALGYLYWLQTECPRDGSPRQKGYPELKPHTATFDTPDGIAPKPYVRESRRIRAIVTVVEQDIVVEDGFWRSHQRGVRARRFDDSCGIGHYKVDIHGSPRRRGLYLETRPFQIPFGALIPIRMTNLLAASKNLGVTHITNGAYRMHSTEWNIGEAAGALAAFCVQHNAPPRAVHAAPSLRRAYQRALLDAGIPLYWWTDLSVRHPAFKAAQYLAVTGVWPDENRLRFRPDAPLTPAIARQIEATRPRPFSWPAAPLTRAQAALWLMKHLQ